MRLFVGLLGCALAYAEVPPAVYVSSSIVNAANAHAQPLAPNTIATLFGKNLAASTHGLQADDLIAGQLPTLFAGTGVRVYVAGIAAPLFYVSPTQINFLVPPQLKAGTRDINIALEGRLGPTVAVEFADVSPALFQLDPEYTIATRPDGSLVDKQHPARPGDIVILYANGLGWTKPRFTTGQVATAAAPLERLQELRLTLDGTAVDRSAILYAGIAPGFAGLYQINIALPANLGNDPEIRIGFGERLSPSGVRLAALR